MSLEYSRCLGWDYCHNICEFCNGFYTDTSANTVITSPDIPINEEITEDDLDKATPENVLQVFTFPLPSPLLISTSALSPPSAPRSPCHPGRGWSSSLLIY